MFVAFLGEEIVGFGCSMFLPIWVSPMVVRKEILSLPKHKPRLDYQPALILGLILIFQRPSSSPFHGIPPGYCPGWNFARSEHDIVPGTVSSIGFWL